MEFNVMLAKPAETNPDYRNGKAMMIQPKLDGVRCYITRSGAYSRNHKTFYNVKHILTELKPLFANNPNLVLDGELYNHKFKNNFNKIISLVRKQKPTQADKFESASYLQFHCYDMFDYNATSLSFIERTLLITDLKSKYKLKFTQEVETKVVYDNSSQSEYHNHNKSLGYEGSILRTPGSAYDQRRSNHLQKVKDWSDTEATITGFVEGKGKFANGLGKLLGIDADGRAVEIPWPTMTIPDRQGFWHNRALYIGKQVTFEYFERTPSGAYRFPRAKVIRNYE
jgi:DNA ligase-1